VRLLDRYILREIIGPLGLGFLVYTFILLLDALFDSAEMIIRRGLPVRTVGELLLLALPNIVVLTIPMSLLFGVLIAIGRLSSDSELVALRATGVSLLSLYRPILILSGFLAALNTALMVFVLPWGNHQLQLQRLTILTRTVSSQVQPRVFWDEWQNQVLYVFETPPGEPWQGVFLAESVPSTEGNRVTVADRGTVRVDPDGERVVLELEGAYVHELDLGRPETYQVSYHRRLEALLEDQFATQHRARVTASKSVRELTLQELGRWAADLERPADLRRLARVEIHKKFAIPFASVVFGIFALPLGFNNRRGSKASGFALSILVIVGYWVLLDYGEKSAEAGGFPPWLAMWGPNLLFAALGFFLLARRNRDKSLLLTKVDRWIRRDVWAHLRFLARRRQQRLAERRERRRLRLAESGGSERPHLVIRLPRFQLLFPNLLDRYVLRIFSGIFVLTVASGLAIYIVADFTGKADEIFRNQVAGSVVVDYYKFSSFQIFYEIAPVLVLVTTLITFSLLSKTNETTALKALGVSLFRISLPAVVAAAGVTLFAVFLQSKVLPAANHRGAQLEDQIRGRETARSYRRADRQWLFGQGRYIYNYINYDADRQTLHRLQVFELDQDHRLLRRLVADRAVYDGDGWWRFENGWFRTFEGTRTGSYERFPEAVSVRFPEDPDYFASEIRPPEQMGYFELRRYVEELEGSGQAVPELRVQLQTKVAYPTLSLVMALVALPFAFLLGRQGALYGVGVSIVLAIVFLIFFAFSTKLGEAGALPPIIAVWGPNLIFALISASLFLWVRT
ncbi:MAG TPA: LptF/LptG family permease, partial [Thermoanaerobaculia bacterium]|nr:LptF/LptG family permease [Thermoanaerobaculia bacterium]